ncbi:MAG: hypothetical protein HY660_06605 [Armatimonadetes bacterium]|nr:hypothetical protein [Armatimonadota bacterium]
MSAPALRPLVVGVDSDPLTLDTRLTSPTQAYPIAQHICDPLTFRKTNGEVIPYLAESWSRDTAVVWRITLRRGVKFHNGEPFDAESAKYSLDCIVRPDVFPKTTVQKRSWLQAIDRVEIVDSHTLRIRTKYPSRSLLSYLSLFGMLPPRAARDLGERFGLQPIGTGPYRFGEYVPGSRLVLEANADWWGGRPRNSGITLRFLPEAATRAAALEAGEVVWINNLPPDRVPRIGNNPRLKVNEVMTTRIMYLYMLGSRAPFNKVQARQAVNHAIDKRAIVASLLSGHGAVARSVYSPAILYFKEQPAYQHDKERVRRLLGEAGMERGMTLRYMYPSGRFLNDKQIGEAIGNMLVDAGLNIQPEVPEWGVYLRHRAAQYAELFLGAYGTLTLDPDYALNFIFPSKTSPMKYNNPRVDELMLKGDQALDPAVARPIYEELQQIIWRDAPAACLYYQPEIHGVSANLVGNEPRPDEYWLFWNMYLR